MTSDCINESSQSKALWFRPKLRWNNSKRGKVMSHEESANSRPQTPSSRPFGKVKNLFSKGFFNLTAGLKPTRRLSLPDGLQEDGAKRWKLNAAYPLIADKLYYCCIPNQYAKVKLLPPEPGLTCVATKYPGQYFPFGKDFGPTCVAVVFRFCDFLKSKLKGGKGVIFCMDEEPRMRTNAAFLLASYLVIVEGKSPDEAMEGFSGFNVDPFLDFCDVMGSTEPEHQLSILSSLQGLHKALQVGIFNLNTFDVARYEFYDDASNGDVHWPCSKLLAFKGPVADAGVEKEGSFLAPEFYVDIFKRHKVSAVVRLNEAERYPAAAFTDAGINHYDLFFEDCSAPSMAIVKQFLEICEREHGSVAVHCRAGLGRTGTLVAAWLMYKHGFSALESVGWIRLVRPGSIVGRQQAFLQQLERRIESLAGGVGDGVGLDGIDLDILDGIDDGVSVSRASAPLIQPLSAPGTLTRAELEADRYDEEPVLHKEEEEDLVIDDVVDVHDSGGVLLERSDVTRGFSALERVAVQCVS